MSAVEPTVVEEIVELCPGLSTVLRTLASARSGRLPARVRMADLLGMIPGEPEHVRAVLHGGLAILYSMGVIRLGPRRVRATSRNAAHLLGSLSRYMEQSVQAIQDPEDRLGLYNQVVKTYETARLRWDQDTAIDRRPLHHCHVVNVVIKAQVTREWERKSVYLHVYHPEWRAYHLIGLGVDGSTQQSLERDKEVAREALRHFLDLEQIQYEFDETINPDLIHLDKLSETSGAFTHYSYRVLVVGKIDAALRATEHLREERGTFRWFTLEEIERGRGRNDETIMFSTLPIMRQLPAESIQASSISVDDVGQPIDITGALGARFTRKQLVIVPGALVILLLIWLLPQAWPALSQSNPLIVNLSGLAQIAYISVTLLASVVVVSLPGRILKARHD